jgi:hypothetical protein
MVSGPGGSARLRKVMSVFAVGGLAGWSGCGGATSRADVSLESPDPSVRVRSVVRAAESNEASVIPLLVDRLEDEDEAVRFYAILALERLTGTRLGYKYGASEAQRRADVERWRRFLVESEWRGATPAAATGR